MAAVVATQTASEPGGSLSYSGNPDFRGYIAANDPSLLGYVGNNVTGSGTTGINTAAMVPLGSSAINNDVGQIDSLYNTFNGIMNGSGSSGSSSSSSGTNPSSAAYYNDIISQLQSELGTTEGEQPTLINNINQQANDETNQLNQQESSAMSGYNTQNAENGQQRESNLGTIATGANSAYNSLMGLLGGSGAGVSSAALYTAPQAISQNASQQRASADTTFNTNASSIATDQNQTQQQYGDALADLTSQEDTDKSSALSSLLGTEATINQDITQAQSEANEYGGENFTAAEQKAPVSAVSNIEDQLGKIFSQYATPTFNVSPVSAATPTLSTYSYDPTTIAAQNSNPNTDSSFAPYLASLKQSQPTSGITTGATAPATPTVTAGAS